MESTSILYDVNDTMVVKMENCKPRMKYTQK